MTAPLLIVDVSPLWELEYTGIANVVCELTRRLLADSREFEVRFSVFHRMIERTLIERCVRERSGRLLKSKFENLAEMIMSAEVAAAHEGATIGLFLHVKPDRKNFDYEAQLHYDFSFLSVPECHHQDTIDYHLRGLDAQIQTNDCNFTISRSVANDLEFYFGCPKERTVVALLGYHLDVPATWEFAARFGNEQVEPYFICIGSIEPRKNVRLILAWLAGHPEQYAANRFLFVGRDAWGESFRELIDEAGLGDAVEAGRILHVGYVNEAQKAALLLGAKALIYPSLFEGFGLPVLEAMALRVPVAASCTTSVPEVLGPDGIYFDPYSVDSFDGAMRQLLAEDAAGTAELRTVKLRARAETFSYDCCVEVIMNRLHDDVKRASSKPR